MFAFFIWLITLKCTVWKLLLLSASDLFNENVNIIIIIMVIFKCYFSREHIALSCKNGMDIELGKTNRLKAQCMMENHT